MGYRLKIATDAAKHIKTPIPHEVIVELQHHLQRLADAPSEHGKPSRFPFLPDEQLYEFSITFEQYKYTFRASYKISQDETLLLVGRLGMVRYDLRNE